MKLLYWLESIRTPFWDKFMLLITHLGEETAFLAIAICVFWCIDKKKGYYMMSVGFLGTIINQFLKMSFRIDRPFELHKDFHAVDGALEEATGFSFPSGHTQMSVGIFGCACRTAGKMLLRIVFVALAILVPFSRLYLGVHTLADVFVSLVIALALIFLIYPFTMGKLERYFPWVLVVMIGLSLSYMVFVLTCSFPENVNAQRLLSGKESAFTLVGCLCGMLIVYIADRKWLNFSVKAVWWAQLIKLIIGLGLVLLVKSGLKGPLNSLFGDYAGRSVRYFLMVMLAGIIWPLTFKWFSRLGNRK